MAEKPPAKISYLDKSYKEAREELLIKAPIISKGIWTDINSAELMTALLELFLGVFDMQMFYQDHQSNEAFLSTARERKNVIRHCNQIGYRLRSWSPSLGNITVRLANEVISYVAIPKYTKLYSSGNIPYFVLEGTYLTNSNPVATLKVAQGEVSSIEYVSSGHVDQSFLIPSAQAAEGSISVYVDGKIWQEVDDDFAKSGPYSEHYLLRLDANNNFSVIFGDGLNRLGSGMIPPERSSITVWWADTLGPSGNVGTGQVASFDEAIPNVYIVSSTSFSGGAEPEKIEEAKKLAPMLLRSLWRGVHRDDVIALSEHFPGIRQASVLDINDFPLYDFMISYYEVWVVVIPEEGDYISSEMKQELLTYLEERKYVTCDLKIIDPEYKKIDIEAVVYKYKDADERLIMAQIEDNLNEMFKVAKSPVASFRMNGYVDGLMLGDDLRFSVIVATIQAIEGVSHITMVYPTGDIPMNYKQIATLGELRINVQDVVEQMGESYTLLRKIDRGGRIG
jgi:hypothetical protein